MTAPIEDVSSLPGNKLADQADNPIGKVKEIYATDDGDGISAEGDRELRDFYGIDAGDQEMRNDNKSYATLVSEESGSAELVEDPDLLETPDADTRSEETMERLNDPGSSETRKVTASDVSHDDQDTGDQDAGGQEEAGRGASDQDAADGD